MTRLLFAALIAVSSLFASTAWGQDDEAIAKAAEEDKRGKELFTAGKYDEAAQAFHRAFGFYPIPQIMKSEIVAWSNAGNCSKAEPLIDEHFESLQTLPPDDVRDVRRIRADCRLTAAEAAFAAGEYDAANAALTQAAELDTEGRKTSEIAALRDRIDEAESPPDTRNPDIVDPPDEVVTGGTERPSSVRPIIGWTLVGTGVAAAGTAGILYLIGSGYRQDLDGLCDVEPVPNCQTSTEASRLEAERLHGRIQTLRTGHIALLAAGGAFTAIGIAVLLTGGSEQTPVSLQLSPMSAALSIGF